MAVNFMFLKYHSIIDINYVFDHVQIWLFQCITMVQCITHDTSFNRHFMWKSLIQITFFVMEKSDGQNFISSCMLET